MNLITVRRKTDTPTVRTSIDRESYVASRFEGTTALNTIHPVLRKRKLFQILEIADGI
jgi:hypothetical protein